jgi:hypothetical protein
MRDCAIRGRFRGHWMPICRHLSALQDQCYPAAGKRRRDGPGRGKNRRGFGFIVQDRRDNFLAACVGHVDRREEVDVVVEFGAGYSDNVYVRNDCGVVPTYMHYAAGGERIVPHSATRRVTCSTSGR